MRRAGPFLLTLALMLVVAPAHAFDAVDGAGIRGTASAATFTSLATTCGAACKIAAQDDQIIPLRPPSGQPDWPFHWSSSISTPGVAGGISTGATVWADTNGYVSFVMPSAPDFTPSALPEPGAPHAMVAGVWADLNPQAATGTNGMYWQITGTTPNRQMAIQWVGVPNYAGTCTEGSAFTFEIRLAEADNSVTVTYGFNRCTAQAAVGGQENSAGTSGITYFNGTSIPDDVAVVYRDVVPPSYESPVVDCGVDGSNGWCRSASNSVTFRDSDDLATTATGTGIRARTWSIDGSGQGPYVNDGAMTVSRSDGTYQLRSTATDWAGGFAQSFTTLNVDVTPPTGSGSPSSPANEHGWFSGDVEIAWSCADATSGAAAQPAPSTIAGEGAGLTASTVCADVAGNSATLTSESVSIDRTKPATTTVAPSGWTTNGTITLSASDNLSGVDKTFYEVDGLAAQEGTTIHLSDGIHAVEFWSVDKAGNVEDPTTIQVKVDRGAPAITHSISPAPNAAGWTRGATTVTFQCNDDTSGIAFCSPPESRAANGAAQSVTGTATDVAGNSATDTAILNIDATPPTITAARSPLPNSHGWAKTAVTVTFTCGDALSGVASCPAPQSFAQGASQSASGSVLDTAGNSASASMAGINVDTTPPTITGTAGPAPTAQGWHSDTVTVSWSCSDALSGIATCPAPTVVSASGISVITSPAAIDKAGNIAQITFVVRIDRTPPTITFQGQTPYPANGWSKSDATIAWNCADAQSSTLTPQDKQTVTYETDEAYVTGTCTNGAGLTASDTYGPVRVDKTAPIATMDSPGIAPLTLGVLGDAITGRATDLLSGVHEVRLYATNLLDGRGIEIAAACTGCGAPGIVAWRVPVAEIGLGLWEMTARAEDRAGNRSPSSTRLLVVVV